MEEEILISDEYEFHIFLHCASELDHEYGAGLFSDPMISETIKGYLIIII